MKIVTNKAFTDAFRELETAIRNNYPKSAEATSPVAFYEDKISKKDPDKANYLTHLRQKRNVITHNHSYTGNVTCSDFDIEFLENLTYEVNAVNGVVKDFYVPKKKLPYTTIDGNIASLSEALKRCKDSGTTLYVGSVDETRVYKVDVLDVFRAIGNGMKLTTPIKKLDCLIDVTGYAVDPSTAMSSLGEFNDELPVFSRKKFVGILR